VALKPEGYWLRTLTHGGESYVVVAGADDRGVLYGAFALLRKVAMGERIAALDEKQSPDAPIRWVNQWDNPDGSIERGYGGRSIFWGSGRVRADVTRVSDYGRMLASLGIDGANWFLRASSIPDSKGRVGRYPNRVEAETMELAGYAARDITPGRRHREARQ
jgi:alpha-glucuronidase